MKVLERNKAIKLRRRGRTFGEILKEVSVSKSTLSYWLRDIALTQKQVSRIQYKNDKIKEKFIRHNELKKKEANDRKEAIINSAIREIDAISKRDLKLVGVALYWAEGYKGERSTGADFINSDPAMIKLMMRWFREICLVQEDQFRIRIQIHNEANIGEANRFWSELTSIPIDQFTKPYTKTSSTSKRKAGNLVPLGICSIRISDVKLINRIRGWIRGLMALSSSPV